MGAWKISSVPEGDPFLAVASAIAKVTGTLVSRRRPAGTQPCLIISVSTMPGPVGVALHHPLTSRPEIELQRCRRWKRYSEVNISITRKSDRSHTTTSNSSSYSDSI